MGIRLSNMKSGAFYELNTVAVRQKGARLGSQSLAQGRSWNCSPTLTVRFVPQLKLPLDTQTLPQVIDYAPNHFAILKVT